MYAGIDLSLNRFIIWKAMLWILTWIPEGWCTEFYICPWGMEIENNIFRGEESISSLLMYLQILKIFTIFCGEKNRFIYFYLLWKTRRIWKSGFKPSVNGEWQLTILSGWQGRDSSCYELKCFKLFGDT